MSRRENICINGGRKSEPSSKQIQAKQVAVHLTSNRKFPRVYTYIRDPQPPSSQPRRRLSKKTRPQVHARTQKQQVPTSSERRVSTMIQVNIMPTYPADCQTRNICRKGSSNPIRGTPVARTNNDYPKAPTRPPRQTP